MAFRLCNRDRMLKPGKCLICETKPGHRVVDTGYNLFATTVFDKLRGRKYICEACGEKIGKALGMAQQTIVNSLKTEIIKLQNQLAEEDRTAIVADQVENLRLYLIQREEEKDETPVENKEPDPA